MPLPLDEFDSALKLIHSAKSIVIISHKNPDPDSIGANLALKEQLQAIGKKVVSACFDKVPENCDFLDGAEKFVQDFDINNVDLVISVDCGSHDLLKFHEYKPELLGKGKRPLINIDHHPTNDMFGQINIVMDKAPATCFILFVMFAYYGWSISKNSATALMHGLYFDTGSFMHSNTTADTLKIAGRLLANGADIKTIVRKQFHTNSISQLRVWGHALSRVEINSKSALCTAITEHDFMREAAKPEDISGLVNYLNHVPEARFCILLTEDMRGNIKGSMRTLGDDVDLSKIAKLFGGGGHKKAAGFTIPGRISSKVIWDIRSEKQISR